MADAAKKITVTPAQVTKMVKKGKAFVRRNDPCPCGSGAKFKKCCQVGHRKGVLRQRKEGGQ